MSAPTACVPSLSTRLQLIQLGLQTLSRIGNWAEMGEAERDRVLRVLGARNKTRLEERKAVVEREEADKRAKE